MSPVNMPYYCRPRIATNMDPPPQEVYIVYCQILMSTIVRHNDGSSNICPMSPSDFKNSPPPHLQQCMCWPITSSCALRNMFHNLVGQFIPLVGDTLPQWLLPATFPSMWNWHVISTSLVEHSFTNLHPARTYSAAGMTYYTLSNHLGTHFIFMFISFTPSTSRTATWLPPSCSYSQQSLHSCVVCRTYR